MPRAARMRSWVRSLSCTRYWPMPRSRKTVTSIVTLIASANTPNSAGVSRRAMTIVVASWATRPKYFSTNEKTSAFLTVIDETKPCDEERRPAATST